MSFSHSSSELSATPAEAVPPVADPAVGGRVQRTSVILNEAILASSSSVRDSLPEQHRAHFETLRQEIIDFAQAHDIPRESLAKPDALREAASKLSIPDLQRLATLLERFEHLLVKKELWKNKEALEYAEEFYHLEKQYTSQVELLEQVGILKEGTITGIDGNIYPIPTLEQIATRLFERREDLETKHDQGFTKLLIVPFGMSLDVLRETFKQFLLSYKKAHRTFRLDTNTPLWTREKYRGADMEDSPNIVYHPKSFTQEGHGGKTKMEILKTHYKLPTLTQSSFPGWTIHLLQPSDPSNPDSLGFVTIPLEGKGTVQGDKIPRPSLEAGKTAEEYLSLLQASQYDPSSPYFQESGFTPEDWIIAFMTHLQETGEPLDRNRNNLIGAFFSSFTFVPCTAWREVVLCVFFDELNPYDRMMSIGARFSVIV